VGGRRSRDTLCRFDEPDGQGLDACKVYFERWRFGGGELLC